MTAIQSSNRKKHLPLNGYISIYGTEDNNKGVLDDMEAEQNQSNPEQMMLEKEKEDVLLARIQKELSPLEKEVLQCFLDGLSYADISAHLNRSEKSVANALGRIRKKLSCP